MKVVLREESSGRLFHLLGPRARRTVQSRKARLAARDSIDRLVLERSIIVIRASPSDKKYVLVAADTNSAALLLQRFFGLGFVQHSTIAADSEVRRLYQSLIAEGRFSPSNRMTEQLRAKIAKSQEAPVCIVTLEERIAACEAQLRAISPFAISLPHMIDPLENAPTFPHYWQIQKKS